MNAAADVIERVARGQSSDPSTDDLTVPLAIECAGLCAEIERLRAENAMLRRMNAEKAGKLAALRSVLNDDPSD